MRHLARDWDEYVRQDGSPNTEMLLSRLRTRSISRTIDERRAARLDIEPLEPEVGLTKTGSAYDALLERVGPEPLVAIARDRLPTRTLNIGFDGILLVDLVGFSRREAAEHLGVRDSALGKYMSQARSRLRQDPEFLSHRGNVARITDG